MINITDSTEFSRLLTALSEDVVDAHIHFQFFEDLIGAHEKHPLVFPESNTFWTYTLQAHLNSSVYALLRVYDQNKRALHLRSWLITIKENLEIFDVEAFRDRLKDNPYVASLSSEAKKPDAVELAKDIAECTAVDPTVNKLIIHRSNLIAHRNVKIVLSTQDSNNDNGVTFDDLKVLLERAKTILNRYSYIFNASVYSTNVISRDDFNCIFIDVEARVERVRQQWARIIEETPN